MPCRRCQAATPPDAQFCPECGAPQTSACAACGAANLDRYRFCTKCGRPLGSAPPAESFGSPVTYTPKHLAERILVSRGALEGERKLVTVLFVDVSGFTSLSERLDPEEVHGIMTRAFELMLDEVHRYEGTVNQFLGDGIMALFGAPLAHEDHALRACYAALRMQESVRRYVAGMTGLAVPVRIRIGINSGEVVVRAIGGDLHMDYSAVGQTTHLAARMEQLAQPGGTLLTRETLQLVEGHVTVRPTGLLLVKGLADRLEAFELIGPGQARSRLQAAAIRGLTRFVGREAELAMLRRTMDRAGAGHGQVV